MIEIKKIKPLFNSVVTTMDIEEINQESEFIDSEKQKGGLSPYQKVIAVGDIVKEIKVGDLVKINPSRFAKKQHQDNSLKNGIVSDNPVVAYNFPIVEINGNPALLLYDRDIDYVVEEYSTTSGTELLN